MLLQTKGWCDHHLQLLLYDIYDYMSMLYGCAVWSPVILYTACSLRVDCTGKLETSHRSALYAILGMNNDLCNELVYILAGKRPL